MLYANAVSLYMLSSRDRLSAATSRIVSKRMDEYESSWVLARKLYSTLYTLCCKEIRAPPKIIRVLPSGTLPQTLDLENFAAANRSRCQQNSSTVELVDDRRRVVAVYYTSNSIRPTLICCGIAVS